jgi:hypothetical protein
MWGEAEFADDTLIPVPPSLIIQAQEEEMPAAAAPTEVKEEQLNGLSLERRLRLFATKPFQGKAMTKLMREGGITGYGDKKEDQKKRINAVVERLEWQPNDESGLPTVVAMDSEELSSFESNLGEWMATAKTILEPIALSAIKDVAKLAPQAEKLRAEFWVRFGKTVVKHYTTVVALPSPEMLSALREYVIVQIVKGKTAPPVSAPEPEAPLPNADKPATRSNAYLLNTKINYDKQHMANGMRILEILIQAKKPEVAEEIALFTRGWSPTISNAVRTALPSLPPCHPCPPRPPRAR